MDYRFNQRMSTEKQETAGLKSRSRPQEAERGDGVMSSAERSEQSIPHPYERRAVVLLRRAGWSVDELTMTFQCSESTLYRVLEQEVANEQ